MTPDETANGEQLLDALSRDIGLGCSFRFTDPIDSFPTSRNEVHGHIQAYLLRVDVEYAIWSRSSEFRRRWCLSDEAQLRVRRKPIQRLIDNAVRRLEKT